MPEQSPYSEKENADGGFSVSDLPNRIDVEFERLMEFIKSVTGFNFIYYP